MCKEYASKHTHKQASTHTTHTPHIITTINGDKTMNTQAFIDFINTTTSKGGATFNLKTQNASKQARDILASTEYKVLAKQHINSNIVQAYHNNKEFKDKLTQVMQELNITVVA